MFSRRSRNLRTRRPLRNRLYRLQAERLEDRTLPAVTFFPDPSAPTKYVVQFSEDAAGASDTLLLRPTSGGELEFQLNGAPFTTDLKSGVPGVQSLALSVISRIDVSLGAGDDTLDVDGLINAAIIPTPGGIVFDAGTGLDTLVAKYDANLTLTPTTLTASNGGATSTITFTGVERASLTGGNSSNTLDASLFTAGPVTLDGGNGDDTMIGGSGNDVLLGTQGKDFLEGKGGNDQLFSGNSGTTLLGGDGNDSLYGGNGIDVVDGGQGADQLFGGNGQDNLYGGAGNDTLDGGNGNDLVDGDSSLDPGNSGTGTDRVVGSANVSWTLSDSTLTGEGTDTLVSIEQAQLAGGSGNNTIDASAFHGATTLQGGGGNDVLIGGHGSNLFIKPLGEIGNVIMIGGPVGSTNEYQLCPQGATSLISTGGFDKINLSTACTGITLDLSQSDGTPQVVDGSNTIALTGAFEQLLGSDFGDHVEAADNTVVMGGDGADTLMATSKSDVTLAGGADADTLQQSGGTTIVMNGDDGLDSLTSTSGTQVTMNGGSDADTLQQSGGTTIVMTGDDGLDSLTSTNGTQVTMNGGSDADTLQQNGGTTIVMNGDDGLDSLTSTSGTQVTMNGGSDADTLQQSGGTMIVMTGDDGLDSLTSTSGTQVTMNGGADADTLQQSGGTMIVMTGDDGLDSLTSTSGTQVTMNGGSDADTLQQSGGTNIVMTGDDGLDSLTSTAGTQVTMNGGADADTLQQSGGTTIVMNGDDGLDSLTSTAGTQVTMNGGADADTLQQSGGTTIVMNGDDGLDSLTSTAGTQVTMNGGSDADTLQQSGGTTIVMNGDDGLDSLTSTAGTQVTMNGGADADTLQQSGGTTIVMNGDDGLDSLTSTAGTQVTMNGGADADSLLQNGGTTITMTGDSGADTLVSVDGSMIVMNGGNDSDTLNLTDTPALNSGTDTVTGGDGNDTYVFAGNALGGVVVNESSADADVDTLDFSSFTGGSITLDLTLTSQQSLGGGTLLLTLSDGMGIENVVGTAFADTIRGNGLDNELLGADLLPVIVVTPPGFDGFTQAVYLDFANQDAGEHLYTVAERDAIEARLEADYALFHFQFSQTTPASGPYATLVFNQLIGAPPGQVTGGFANDLDFRNLNPAGMAYIQVNGILGAPNQPPDTTDNWIALSAKIAAHELGHLVGLLHQDSFGPIGYGIHAPPGAGGYLPTYPGPVAAYETFDHLMGSPASVGSNRFNDIRDLFFGEREALKLAFSEIVETGVVVGEQGALHRTRATAQPLNLSFISVPNTLVTGLNSTKQFAVEAVDVTGAIVLDGAVSESDYYSIVGKKGDLLSIEVLSAALFRLGTNTIDPMLRVYDAAGNLIAFYSGTAFNDDQFEPTDASLFDLRLPADGTFFIEVDTFPSVITGDIDVGGYELFIYRFDAGNANDVGDVLEGRGGNDTFNGAVGNDTLNGDQGNDRYFAMPSGSDVVLDAGGRDTVDLSLVPVGITLDVSLKTGQVQTINAGNTLALNGTVEIVVGTGLADTILGNEAANVLYGGGGADILRGGTGNDILLGGAGNDVLEGDAGRDLLIGGLGADLLKGLGDDDILIGDVTTFDANPTALDAIMAEWTNMSVSYALRVAHLTGTAGGANGSFYLIKGTSVLNDGANDTLIGGSGTDLFFAFAGDLLDDKKKDETAL